MKRGISAANKCRVSREKCVGLRLIITQTCVPDYRICFFSALASKIDSLSVFSGPEYFDSSIKDRANGQLWSLQRRNHFLFGRRLAWFQRINWRHDGSTVFIHEWNPRILSLWRDLSSCRARQVPFLLWGHATGRTGSTGLAFKLRRWISRQADGVICYSESQATRVQASMPNMRVIAAPNACLSRHDCGVTGEEAGRNNIIYVGRIIREKKVDLLLRGFQRACANDPTFAARLLIVGDGPERAALMSLSDNLKISDRVIWFGHQSDAKIIRSAYEQSFTSVAAGSIGLSMMQSLAFGVPVIIAKNEPHGPELEMAREGFNAEFFKSNDPAGLAQKFALAWREWRDIKGRREVIAASTADNCSAEAMADRFIDIALSCVKSRVRTAAVLSNGITLL